MVSIGCSQIELAPTDADEIEAGRLLPTEQMSTYDEDTCASLPLYVNQNLRARDLRGSGRCQLAGIAEPARP